MEKEIEGFPGYTVTADGRVFGARGELKQSKLNGRYWKVGLCKNGIQSSHLVHSLVAASFLAPVIGKPHVNHRDGNKLNNDVDNLEWSNYSHNIQHAWNTGLRTKPSREDCVKRLSNAWLSSNARFSLEEASDIIEMKHVLGLTNRQVAKYVGCHENTIKSLVAGKTRYFTNGVMQ